VSIISSDSANRAAPSPVRARKVAVLAPLTAVALLAVGYIFFGGPHRPVESRKREPINLAKAGIPAFAIDKPPTVAAARANVRDEAQVLGVSLQGKHRAYLLKALKGSPMGHIINDLLDDLPVTVSYCDMTQCAKVFTGESRGEPLNILFGGRIYRRLCLRIGDNGYIQDTLQPLLAEDPPFPYTEIPFVRTTWKEWREAHPDTDIFVGGVNPFVHKTGSDAKAP
jgi:hypothetical protein